MVEEWRDIPQYEGIYQVSSLGRVRRLAGVSCRQTRLLRIQSSGHGQRVGLERYGITERIRVEKLVISAFVGWQNDCQIKHKNSNKADNRLENLVCSPSVTIQWWETWTPELAYIIGLAFADGGIGKDRNSLTIAQSKADLLMDILSIAPGGNLTFSEGAKVWRLRYCFPNLNSILAKYGLVPNKTRLGFWPLHLPDEMLPHYVRGFFDGDGHISSRNKGFGSTVGFVCHLEPYLQRLKSELSRFGIEGSKILTDGNNYRLRYNSQNAIRSLYAFFYNNASIYSHEKHSKYVLAVKRLMGDC